MDNSWEHFIDQFRETEWERQERWRKTREKRRETREKRRAEGKCWQCAKLIAECHCPYIFRAIKQDRP